MNKTKTFFVEFNIKNKKISINKNQIKFQKIETRNLLIYLLGDPKKGNQNLYEYLSKNKILIKKEFIKKINGEFILIIFDKKKKLFFLINDRFTSIPIYYIFSKNNFYFSNNYLYLYKKLKKKIYIKLKSSSFIEFLLFRKLHGNKTFDTKIKYLDYASIMKINKNLALSKYWFPDFKKKQYKNLNDCSISFIKAISDALKHKIDKKKNINLFLSGGLDTRIILASLLKLELKPKCYTFGFSKNSEYLYSKKLTQIYNLKHKFIKLHKHEILKNLKYKFFISNGMYNHFINFFSKKKIQSNKHDITFHGHGLDYLFQGMYLPSHQIKILNKDTHLKFPFELKNQRNLLKYYYYKSTYKTRNFIFDKYFKVYEKKNIEKKIISNLKKDFKELNKIKINNDKWEYILIKNLSRHYSHLDVISLSEYGNEKKIAYENNLFDFYLSLKNSYRFDGRMVKNSLRIMNRKFADIPSANHAMKITYSSKMLFIRSILNKFLYIITSNIKYKHPSSFQRTFPDLDIQIRNSKKLQNQVSIMFKSNEFKKFLEPLNFDKIYEDYESMLKNENKNFGQTIFLLLHLYKLKKFLD